MAAGNWGLLCGLVAEAEELSFPEVYEQVARRLYSVLTSEQEARLLDKLTFEVELKERV